MEADYVILYMIRDRLNDAQASARVAALLGEANRSQGPSAVKARFTDLKRELLNGARNVWARSLMRRRAGHESGSIRRPA